MSPTKGWFESDDDYRSRVAREADERTIEDSTGSAPSKGWLENDDDYRDRISREADEHKIEDSTGSAPSKGWFENDDNYRDRIHRESNERTIEDSTGSAPSKGWFESDDNYDTRIRKESNEQILLDSSGSAPKKGWFEGDHGYRSRIAHEAREIRASEHSIFSTVSNSDSSFTYDTDSSYSQSSSSTSSHSSPPVTTGSLFPAIIVGVLVLIVLALFQSPSTVKQQPSASLPPHNEIPSWLKTTTATRLRFKGPAFGGMVAAGQRVALTLHVADAPNCTSTSSGSVECQVILYSGGRPNPGIGMDVFRREFALVIDEVDMTMELQTVGGDVISRSRTFAAGATPGYQQVIVASKLPPGEYRVVASSGKRGHFSVLWSEPLGD